MTRELELHFFQTETGYDLVETCFTASEGHHHRCLRGRSLGIIPGAGLFPWSSGVRAATALSLRHLLSEKAPGIARYLEGTKGSLAASLDYALSKGPLWLSDMFGVASDERLFARTLFVVTNVNRKRVGPVTIRLNTFALSPSHIRVFVDRQEVTEVSTLLEILHRIDDGLDLERATKPPGAVPPISACETGELVPSITSTSQPQPPRCPREDSAWISEHALSF